MVPKSLRWLKKYRWFVVMSILVFRLLVGMAAAGGPNTDTGRWELPDPLAILVAPVLSKILLAAFFGCLVYDIWRRQKRLHRAARRCAMR